MVGFNPATQPHTIPTWTNEVGMRKLIAEGINVAEPIRKSRMFLQNAVSPRLALEDSTQPYFCANQHQEDFFQGLVILSPFIQEPIGPNSGAGTNHP